MTTPKKGSAFPYLLMSVALAGVVAFYFYLNAKIDSALTGAVLQSSESANTDVTQFFVNDVYDALAPDIKLTSDPSNQPDTLTGETFSKIDDRIRHFMMGTHILKVKIYNLKGITIYSSDQSQIGSDYTGNLGYETAAQGLSYSVSTLRGEFKGYSGVVYNRDVVSSYIPIRQQSFLSGPRTGRVIGVAEIYADRTEQMNAARRTVMELQILTAIALFVLLVFLATASWLFAVNLNERFVASTQDRA